MPTEKEHLAQYKKNKSFYESIESDVANAEWVIIAIFYSAVHLVDKILAVADEREKIVHGRLSHPKTHEKRHESLQLLKDFAADKNKLYNTYISLEIKSEQARYYCKPFYNPEKEIKKAKQRLAEIEKIALKY